MKKIIKEYSFPIIFLALIISTFIFLSQSSSIVPHIPKEVELIWVKSSELDKIPLEIRNNLQSKLNVEFETLDDDYLADPSNDNYKEYNKLTSNENNYYLKYNSSSQWSSSKDLILPQYIEAGGKAKSKFSLCAFDNPYNCVLYHKRYDGYARHWVEVEMDTFEKRQDWNYDCELAYGWLKSGEDSWGNPEYQWYDDNYAESSKDRSFKLYINYDYVTEPYMKYQYNVFLSAPPNLDFDIDSGKTSGGTPYHEAWWSGDVWGKTFFYLAKSPAPIAFDPQFTPDINEPGHTNWMDQIDIKFQPKGFDVLGMKVVVAQFYEIMNDGSYVLMPDRTQVSKISDEFNDGGVKGLAIYPQMFNIDDEGDTDYFQEGRYVMALGIIDKFNKIYFIEPQYFIIDRAKPIITNNPDGDLGGAIINDKTTFNTSDIHALIMEWGNFTDNYTAYDNQPELQKDFIYIDTGEFAEAKPVSDKYFDDKIIINTSKRQLEMMSGNEGESLISIKSLYVRDKADNRVYFIEDYTHFIWDRINPVVTLHEDVDVNKIYMSDDTIKFRVNEKYNISVKEAKLLFGDEEVDPIYYHYASILGDVIVVKLNKLKLYDGLFTVKLVVEDECGNENQDQLFQFLSDGKNPDLGIWINDELVDSYYNKKLNGLNKLYINVVEANFDHLEVGFESNSGSRQTFYTTTEKTFNLDLIKENDVEIEDVVMKVKAFDKSGNFTKLDYINIHLYNDIRAPEIYISKIEDWKYRLEVFDSTRINKVYIKYIDLDGSPVTEDSFIPLPPDVSWDVVADQVMSYQGYLDLLPQRAVCVFADDQWGNINIPGVIIENNKQTNIVIEKKADLNNYLVGDDWELYGNVLIKTNLSIDPNETLVFKTDTSQETIVNLDSTNDQLKIISNGGTIRLDRSNNNIKFIGKGDFENNYNWFGFQIRSGDFEIIDSTNKIFFESAVVPMTFYNPVDSVVVENIDFINCFMGIHFLDETISSTSYNNLTVRNISFNDMVYGVKFEIDSYENTDNYISALDHLTDENMIINNITKGQVYCPVTGLNKFVNFNTAPYTTVVEIPGEKNVGVEITGTYDYYDDDGDEEKTTIDGTKFQWFSSSNKSGPFTKIEGANNKSWTPTVEYQGQWIRLGVTPVDKRGAIGTTKYSKSNIIGNQPPSAENLKIDGKLFIAQPLTAVYDFIDPDNDTEGISLFQWYVCDDPYGLYQPIPNATNKSWTVDSIDYANKWIKYRVIPRDQTGLYGEPAYSTSSQIGEAAIPRAFDINVQGVANPGQTLTVSYEFEDPNGLEQGNSILDWQFSTEEFGEYSSTGDHDLTWDVDENLMGKWVKFVVIPVNIEGLVGLAAESSAMLVNDINKDIYDSNGNHNNDFWTAALLPVKLSYNPVNPDEAKEFVFEGFVDEKNKDKDYFLFYVDDPLSGDKKYTGRDFHLRIKFLENPDNAYGIKIWQGNYYDPTAEDNIDDTEPPNPNTAGQPEDESIYKQYDWGVSRTGPYHDTEKNFAIYYVIEIFKHDVINGPNWMYKIEISNGKYSSYNPE